MNALGALLVGLVLLSACSSMEGGDRAALASEPAETTRAEVAASPGPGSTTAPLPTSGPSVDRTPVGAGIVPDAGVLFVQGVDDQIYRYDGATGRIDAVSRAATFDGETTEGVYVVGRHGGAELLGWGGTKSTIECGTGFADVSRGGACASAGQDGVEVKLADDVAPRLVLPADWRGSSAVWSPDGRRLILIRTLADRSTTGLDPGLSALWLMEADGRVREVYRPPDRGVLNRPSWSPDGRQVLVWHVTTTSASFAADGVGITARIIDVSSGASSILGTVMNRWVDWAPDGRLAFVRGGGRGSWDGKELFVREPTGVEYEIRARSADERVALAPSWDRSGTRLAWVSGPESHDLGGTEYMAGVGPASARR